MYLYISSERDFGSRTLKFRLVFSLKSKVRKTSDFAVCGGFPKLTPPRPRSPKIIPCIGLIMDSFIRIHKLNWEMSQQLSNNAHLTLLSLPEPARSLQDVLDIFKYHKYPSKSSNIQLISIIFLFVFVQFVHVCTMTQDQPWSEEHLSDPKAALCDPAHEVNDTPRKTLETTKYENTLNPSKTVTSQLYKSDYIFVHFHAYWHLAGGRNAFRSADSLH